jgi:hypothetical protein
LVLAFVVLGVKQVALFFFGLISGAQTAFDLTLSVAEPVVLFLVPANAGGVVHPRHFATSLSAGGADFLV